MIANIQRFIFLRNKGLRFRLAWYLAELPRRDEIIGVAMMAGAFLLLVLLVVAVTKGIY